MNLNKFVKKFRKAIVITIFMIGFLVSSINVSADPTVNSITTNPAEPKPLSTFTVIADISGENIISVKVTISECTDGPPMQCFLAHSNLIMSKNDDGKYETEVTLNGTQASIDHVQYLFIINDNGTEYPPMEDEEWKTYLDVDSDNGGTNGGGGDNGSPGFELILILSSIFVLLIILKKRDKK
jgi:hypothetical protein